MHRQPDKTDQLRALRPGGASEVEADLFATQSNRSRYSMVITTICLRTLESTDMRLILG